MGGRTDVTLVRHVESQQLFVKKRIPASSLSICRELQRMKPAGIPGIYHVIDDGDSIVVIEEFVNGITVAEYLEQNERFSEETAISIVRSLCSILSVLHNATPPIIHRDIKPSNVLIDSSFSPVLIDFDASKMFDRDKNKDTVLMGTAAFAAPEQFGYAQSDARTDVYALGVLLNVMLTGTLPSDELYEGKLADVITKCTAIDPDDRYKTVMALASHLHENPRTIILPGFRSGKPWKMIVATVGYLIILVAAFGMEIENGTSVAGAWCYRFSGLILLLSIVAFAFDWAGISSTLPLSNSKKPIVSWLGRLFWVCVIFFLVIFLLSFVV